MPKYMPKAQTMETGKNKEGAISLNYPMLTRANYTAWAMKMKVYMQAHGVWEAVAPKDPKTTTVDDKVDKIALAAIYQGIPEDVLLSLADKGTAKEAWEAIKIMCQGAERVKTAKVQNLKAEFESMIMRDSDSIDDFSMKLNGVVTNIRALGEEIAESYVVKKLLRAVPSKFTQLASTIEQFGDLEKMTVEEAIGSFKAHEERLRGQVEVEKKQLLLTKEEWLEREKDETKLLLTREEWMKRTGREYDSSKRFRTRDNSRSARDKSKVRCFSCNGYGHYAAECKKGKRDKEPMEEAHFSQIPDEEPALLMVECEKNDKVSMLINEEHVVPKLTQGDVIETTESNLWYLDNGASNHMTGQHSKFDQLDTKVTGQVRFGDGSLVKIEGKGSITLLCKNGERRTLRDVYYIPSLRNNIISLGQMTEEGYKVVIKSDSLWIHDD